MFTPRSLKLFRNGSTVSNNGYNVAISCSIEDDVKRDVDHQISAYDNTSEVKSLKNGDFTEDEIKQIMKDLQKSHPGKKFKIKDKE